MEARDEQQSLKLLAEHLDRIEGALAELHRKVDELHRKMDRATLHAVELAKQYQVRP